MKLSVVIPTYNRKDSLRRTLDGLTRQTYPASAFEVVVVSDGSTDGTDAMLAEYARTAPYTLRPFTQPNSGPSVARNRGFREAQNDVIVFLDDDVEPVPAFLHCHAAHHETDEKIVVLGPMSPDPACAPEEPVWIAWEHAKLQQTYDLFRPGGAYFDSLAGPMHFYSGNASVRRRWLEAVGGFDETFKRQEDVELASRMAEACGVHFVFDFNADGLHRPARTFDSWLNIPRAYGTLDAQRVQAGQLTLESVQAAARARNGATRLLSGMVTKLPVLSPLVIPTFKTLALTLHRRGSAPQAQAVLSGLYNACYMQEFSREYARPRQSEAVAPSPDAAHDERQPINSLSEMPMISVIVCTRNRQDNALHTARTILASDYPNFELLIVDQSDDNTTAAALLPLAETDARLHYFHQSLPGKPRALNFARTQARGKYLLLTDDDCERQSRWLWEIEAAFRKDSRIGCVFGEVQAPPHDKTKWAVADANISRANTILGLKEYLQMPGKVNFGIGANMAVRSDVARQLNGWDSCMGPGAKSGSGDDHDMTVRILIAGHAVHFCPTACVVHYGFRPRDKVADDVVRIAGGFGMAFAKYLRCGVVYYGSWRMLRHFLLQIGAHFWKNQRPYGMAFPRGWIRGFVSGLRLPIDRYNFVFQPLPEKNDLTNENKVAQVVLRNQQTQNTESAKPV